MRRSVGCSPSSPLTSSSGMSVASPNAAAFLELARHSKVINAQRSIWRPILECRASSRKRQHSGSRRSCLNCWSGGCSASTLQTVARLTPSAAAIGMGDGFIVGSPVWPHWAPPVLQSHWPTGLFATPCANERIIGRPAWLRSGRRWRPRRGGSGCSHTPGRRWPHAWPQSAHAGRSNA